MAPKSGADDYKVWDETAEKKETHTLNSDNSVGGNLTVFFI